MLQPKNAIAFAPLRNTGGDHPSDATYFADGARGFLGSYGLPKAVHLFDNQPAYAARLAQVLGWIADVAPASIDTFVFASHGWQDGLQWGADLHNVGHIAETIKHAAAPNPIVILYACSAARDNDKDQKDDLMPGPGGDGGMADMLRDALVAVGVRATVYAHAKPGDAFLNPYVRRFVPTTSAGGEWVVSPDDPQFHAWARALKGPLRFQFPMMRPEEIQDELRSIAGAVA